MFFESLSRKVKFHQNLIRIQDTLHEDQCTFMIIFRSVLLRMIIFQREFVEKI